MGSLILCHRKRASQPYEIARVHRRIYTIEELCYYLCNNLYLIDYTIMNETLCRWIDKELELKELSGELLGLLENQGSIEQFVLCILEYSKIYSEGEIMHIHSVLEKLKNQKDIERQKYKGDNLLESGELEAAILVYQSILREEQDETVGEKFYGRVCGCLGAAYGRSLLYEEAASMYQKGYEICQDHSMLIGYLYACSMYMPREGYQALLTRSEVLVNADLELEVQKEKILKTDPFHPTEEEFMEWRRKYRKM